MSWLSKLLNYVPQKEREGISLGKDIYWEISSAKELPSFLRALIDLIPPESILYLEGGTPTSEIKEFLENRKASITTKVAIGTIWPRPECYHIPITRENLEELARLTEKIATPEAAIHLHVYSGNKVLLEWHDAFDDSFYLSKEIPEDRIKNFCSKLGIEFKKFDHL